MRYSEYLEGAEGVDVDGWEDDDRYIWDIDLVLYFFEEDEDVFEVNTHTLKFELIIQN